MNNFWAMTKVSHEIFRKIMRSELKMEIEPTDCDGKFYSHKISGQVVGLIWSKDKGVHLMHECLHATFWAVERKGIELVLKSEEIYCYHQQFLFKCLTGGFKCGTQKNNKK